MMDIIYCPRRHCQYPVTCDPDDHMAKCPVCQYAFCVRCKMVYHGVEPCKISSGMRIILLKMIVLYNIQIIHIIRFLYRCFKKLVH